MFSAVGAGMAPWWAGLWGKSLPTLFKRWRLNFSAESRHLKRAYWRLTSMPYSRPYRYGTAFVYKKAHPQSAGSCCRYDVDIDDQFTMGEFHRSLCWWCLFDPVVASRHRGLVVHDFEQSFMAHSQSGIRDMWVIFAKFFSLFFLGAVRLPCPTAYAYLSTSGIFGGIGANEESPYSLCSSRCRKTFLAALLSSSRFFSQVFKTRLNVPRLPSLSSLLTELCTTAYYSRCLQTYVLALSTQKLLLLKWDLS